MQHPIDPASHRVWATFFEKMGWEFVYRPGLKCGNWQPDFLLPKPKPYDDGRKYFLVSVMPTCELDPIWVHTVNTSIVPIIDEIEMCVLVGDSLIDDCPWLMGLGWSLVSFNSQGQINPERHDELFGKAAWRTAHITLHYPSGKRALQLWPDPGKIPECVNGIARIGYTGNDQMYGLDLNISSADMHAKYFAKQKWLEACIESGHPISHKSQA